MRFPTLLLWVVAQLALATAADAAAKAKAKPAPVDPPMTVAIMRSAEPGCEPLCPQWIAAEGRITAQSPALFRKVLKQAGKMHLPVLISSPGGDVAAALAIGEMIRKRRLDVVVGWTLHGECPPGRKGCVLPKEHEGVHRGLAMTWRGYCFSACPFILAAGTRRLAGTGTSVGVHQISRTMVQERIRYKETYRIVNGKRKVLSRKMVGRKKLKSTTSTRIDRSLRRRFLAYLDRMGIERSFLDLVQKAPPTDIHLLDRTEAESTKLVTEFSPAFALIDARLCRAAQPAENCIATKGMWQHTEPKPLPDPAMRPDRRL